MAARSVQAASFKALDRTFDDLKQARVQREAEWQLIADAFMPRKDFSLPLKPTELRRRRLTSSVPPIGLDRGAALLVAHLIDPTRPFIKPNAARGLVAAGRPTDLDDESRDYLSDLEWIIRDRMMLPRSGFLTAISRMAVELEGFGTAVVWCVRKRGFGPVYQCRPLRASWISEDEDGMVDTLFFQFTLPIWKAVARWPDHGIAEWTEAMASDKPEDAKKPVTILHAVYPRQGGLHGAEARAKPFAEVYACCEHQAILFEGGYDSFPGAVPRLNVEEGSCYGTGMAWKVLPEALVLNSLQASIERGAELRNDPPLMMPKRMFAKPLDRRAGSVNYYDAAGLGFQNATQAVQRLDIAGDVSVAATMLQGLEQNVEQAFFIDWMRLRDSGNMTAEEVRERRAMRIGAMSAIVPGVDRDLMGPLADRTLDVLNAEGALPRPPAALSGAEVDWDYSGPLAIAQLKGQAEAMGQLMNSALIAKEIDPDAAYVINVEEGLREIGEALAVPPQSLRSRAAVADHKAQQERARALAQNAELMNAGATAIRDGGQGIASLAGVAGQERGVNALAGVGG